MKSKGEKTAKRKGASYRTLKKGTLMTTLEQDGHTQGKRERGT